MKPHRLEIFAFGAYPDQEQIDFDLLAEEGLFLIHGPTGAGKTTLLDAMCFALFGEVPGDKGKERLVSDFVKVGTKPLVMFEFSVSGGRYRVTRSPAHEGVKKGGGTIARAGEANLDRFDHGEWNGIATRVSEVKVEVERLLGLTASQFQQVILLPQGKFEQVLRAGSEQREQLLKSLFDTSLFQRMTSTLDDRARNASVTVGRAEDHAAEVRDQAWLKWRGLSELELPAVEGETIEGETIEGEPTDQAGLDLLVARSGALLEDSTAEVEKAAARLETALGRQRTAEATADRWDRRSAALAEQSTLLEQIANVELERRSVAIATAADLLRTSLMAETSSRSEFEAAVAALARARDDWSQAMESAASLPAGLAALGSGGEGAVADIDHAAELVATHRSELGRLAELSVSADVQSDSAHRATAEEVGLVADADRSEAERVGGHERLDATLAELTEARAAEERVGELEQASLAAADRLRSCTALSGARVILALALTAKQSSAEELMAARERSLELRIRYLDGIAATLAAELEEGGLCPVCGSTDHPNKARPAADAVDRDEVDAAEASVSHADSDHDVSVAAWQRAEAEALVLEVAAGDLDVESANAAALEAETAWQQACVLAASRSTVEGEVVVIRSAIASSEEARDASRAKAMGRRAEAAAMSQTAQGLRAEVAKMLGEGVDLELAVAQIGMVADAISSLRSALGELSLKRSLHEQAEGRLTDELARSPFADAVDATSALLGGDQLAILAARVNEYDRSVQRITTTLDAADLQSLPDERPDTESMAAVSKAEHDAHTAAVERRATLADSASDIDRLAGEHRSGDDHLVGLRRDATELQSVFQRCAGKAPPRISVQRWVLATYLEEICQYANLRLDPMTAGRYRLAVDRDAARNAGQSGLGLRVFDAHTGEDRDVSTMSGGETFQASLALALGVADTVAAHAGGVHLGALFVDEGFGTLDPESLQLAMDELDHLREGGRMVGVISHVAALRERIGYGIEVTKSDRGSSLRVCEVGPV